MGNKNPEIQTKALWTPEQIIQVLKEIVTAILGIFVVGSTILIAAMTFSYAGQEKTMADAKDVLMLMLGLAGVVVGYYFGRVPADARATQAQEQANSATARAEKLTIQARTMADQVDQVMEKVGPAPAALRSAGAPPTDITIASDLLRIRDGLRAMGFFGK
ncbi:MAG: hypothetical protein ACYC24_01595 [Desulfobacteria bacterium]